MNTRPLLLLTLALACATPLAVLGGCGRTVFERPIDTSYDSRRITGQTEFFHSLPGRSGVTNDEAMHAIVILAENIDQYGSYESRVARFKELGWLGQGFNEPANMYAQRGTVASLLSHVLGIEGGVMMRLTDKSPRYASRELQYMGMMTGGTENQVISGQEFLDVLGRAQDYQVAQAVQRMRQQEATPPSDLPAEQEREIRPQDS